MLSSGVNLYIQLHLHVLLFFPKKKIVSVHNGGKFMINFHEKKKRERNNCIMLDREKMQSYGCIYNIYMISN